MLYVAAVLFAHNFFPTQLYSHFLFLPCFNEVLLTNNMENNTADVKVMLKTFVTDSQKMYGKSIISYNVHSLLHLPEDYNCFGNLEKVSAFPFESYLGTHIKGSVRSG